MDLDPQTVKQTAPGLLGALGAVFFLRGSWPMRLGLVLPGGAGAYYGAPDAAAYTGMSLGLAGFVVGLLGMVIIAKVVATWQDFDLGPLLVQAIRKVFRMEQGGGQ